VVAPSSLETTTCAEYIMILHYDIDEYLMILIILLSSVRIKNIESITLNL
jgi:hypothetical protein